MIVLYFLMSILMGWSKMKHVLLKQKLNRIEFLMDFKMLSWHVSRQNGSIWILCSLHIKTIELRLLT